MTSGFRSGLYNELLRTYKSIHDGHHTTIKLEAYYLTKPPFSGAELGRPRQFRKRALGSTNHKLQSKMTPKSRPSPTSVA